ncbi:MAG: glucose 1-dehydrogenase [Actinomycetota bacterium]|jgi:NAD(P)-dependent dehydrogenase (short-subunit alcohol dehydrogenase family)|nr:glucose 1-dehydrogenase [Actinomycetota bacterium]
MAGLEGRVAIVTGGGGGLGEGICSALAAAGASVAVADVDLGKAERMSERVSADGGRCVPVEVDISDRGSVEAMVGKVAEEFGGVDILVNNAAVYPLRPWMEIEEDEWDRVMSVNVKGYFLCSRAAFPFMKERGGGRIINIASVTFFVGQPGLLSYVSSKGGVVGFTRTLAREIGSEGVTVNAISPGAFPTDAEKIHPNQEEYNQRMLDQQSVKRRGRPGDIGNLAAFLASDAASFITGQTIEVDGGWVMR